MHLSQLILHRTPRRRQHHEASPIRSARHRRRRAAPFGAAVGARAPQNKVNLGVAIPAATHSFTAGIVCWANQAKKDLEKAHPDLKVTVKTAATRAEQANQLQDLLTVNKINTLVIFPFESAALTKPVAQVKSKGVYVTVVDRGLTDTSAQDAYVVRRQHRLRQDPGRVHRQGAERQGQHRGAARHPDHDRQRAHGRVQRGDEELSRHQAARRQVRATGTATTPSR